MAHTDSLTPAHVTNTRNKPITSASDSVSLLLTHPIDYVFIEALVGEVGGDHMVRLEDQGVITDDGFEIMSAYPWDQLLFPR